MLERVGLDVVPSPRMRSGWPLSGGRGLLLSSKLQFRHVRTRLATFVPELQQEKESAAILGFEGPASCLEERGEAVPVETGGLHDARSDITAMFNNCGFQRIRRLGQRYALLFARIVRDDEQVGDIGFRRQDEPGAS